MKPRSAQAPKSKKTSSNAAKGAAAVPPKLAQAAQEVRIMGGQWKRTVLPVAHLPGLRPTPSRVRETLFNWLGQDLSGWRCLDAFAGTGALGLEAASRGASAVWLVEQSAQLLPNLQRVVTKLNAQDQVQVHRADALALLHAQRGAAWDVIFLDPPFQAPVGAGVVASSTSESPVFAAALQAAAAAIGPQGWVYLEAPRAWSDDQLAPMGLCVHRHLKAGMVHAHLLRLVAHT